MRLSAPAVVWHSIFTDLLNAFPQVSTLIMHGFHSHILTALVAGSEAHHDISLQLSTLHPIIVARRARHAHHLKRPIVEYAPGFDPELVVNKAQLETYVDSVEYRPASDEGRKMLVLEVCNGTVHEYWPTCNWQ